MGVEIQTAAEPPPQRCLNCNAVLTGPWCAECGQRDERRVHTVGHFMHEAFEGLTHADSRLWNTLVPLLLKPGFLTREFFSGRRQRFLPPLRLYIVITLAFFLLASLMPSSESLGQIGAEVSISDTAPLQRKGEQLDERLAELRAELAEETEAERRRSLEFAIAAVEKSRGEVQEQLPKAGELPEVKEARDCNFVWDVPGTPSNWLTDRLSEGCRKAVKDKGLLASAILHNIPRALFFLLPLMAAYMLLIYWNPRRYYVEHLLLLIHNHAALFLLGIVYLPVEHLLGRSRWPALSGWFTAFVLTYAVWYCWRAMHVYYGQSRTRTSWKFLFLGFTFFIVNTIMTVFTVLYSVATL